MQVLHHGAWGGLTGPCWQLLIDAGHDLLIGCGLFFSAETSADNKSDAARLGIDIAASGMHPKGHPQLPQGPVRRLPRQGGVGTDYPLVRSQGCHFGLDGLRIAICDSYLAHADEKCLLNFATRMHYWHRDIWLVHGE
ncbi:hypothetical protein D3C78_1095620 [compost metagenome]